MEPSVGLRLRLLQQLDDPFNPYEAGSEGTITAIDDLGQIHVKWDSGGTLAVIPEEDHYEIYSPIKPMLDFSGMTDEQIETFIVNTDLSYEVDAMISTGIDKNGFMHKGEVEADSATGWISGQILGMDVSQNIGLPVDDAYIKALEFFRNAEFDLQTAADDFDTKYGPLL